MTKKKDENVTAVETEDLKAKLQGRTSGGVYLTTIQSIWLRK